MTTHDSKCHILHQEFLKKWPLEKVKTMGLHEYNSQGNSDTFCYWLERRAKALGVISGSYSTIFEIFERKPDRPAVDNKSLKSNGRYTWYRRNKGETHEEVFPLIRDKIVKIIEAAQVGEIERIEKMNDFPPMTRWKIAFIYAPLGTLTSVLAPAALRRIAIEHGIESRSIADMHRQLISLKPREIKIYQYCLELFWPRFPQYYVIGSKYGKDARTDIFELMHNESVVCTDFGPSGLSLAEFYPEPDIESLKTYLEEYNYEPLEYSARQLSLFLSMRLGDIVAVKISGNPKHGKPYLGIRAYAVVVERDGRIYKYDETLGHCLNVEFIKTDFLLEMELGAFSQTVHKVEDQAVRSQIFQQFAEKPTQQILLTQIEKEQEKRRRRKGVNDIIDKQNGRRTHYVVGTSIIDYRHTSIQFHLLEYLKAKNDSVVIAEEDFIDIKRSDKNGKWIELYEIKPYIVPSACIREALGQLLDYARWIETDKELKIIVVGPSVPSIQDKKYIQFIRDNLKLDFCYKAWKNDFE